VSERPAPTQVSNSHHQFRLDPLRPSLAQRGDGGPFGGQSRHALAKRLPLAALQSEERTASELQAVLTLAGEQGNRRSTPLVDLRPDQDQAERRERLVGD
jgi:hypothetical protein